MSIIIAIAASGFGKSTSICNIPELGIKGLDPKKTFLISVKNKALPVKGGGNYIVTTPDKLSNGNRIITNDGIEISKALVALASSPFTNIVIDDFNYIMQDFYMRDALKGGWDTPKKIGYTIGQIFSTFNLYKPPVQKNIFILAHGEEIPTPDGRTTVKMKTTGKMVNEYCTPEGLAEITLIGSSRFDTSSKKVVREYLVNETEHIVGAKSPFGMFDSTTIPNDLGRVDEAIRKYYEWK